MQAVNFYLVSHTANISKAQDHYNKYISVKVTKTVQYCNNVMAEFSAFRAKVSAT